MFLWYLDQIKKHTHPPTYGLQTSQIRGAHDWSYQSEWFLFATMFFRGFLVEKRTTFSSEKSQEKSFKQVQGFRISGVQNISEKTPQNLSVCRWKILMPLFSAVLGYEFQGVFFFFPPVDANDDGFGPRSTSAFLPFRCGTL